MQRPVLLERLRPPPPHVQHPVADPLRSNSAVYTVTCHRNVCSIWTDLRSSSRKLVPRQNFPPELAIKFFVEAFTWKHVPHQQSPFTVTRKVTYFVAFTRACLFPLQNYLNGHAVWQRTVSTYLETWKRKQAPVYNSCLPTGLYFYNLNLGFISVSSSQKCLL